MESYAEYFAGHGRKHAANAIQLGTFRDATHARYRPRTLHGLAHPRQPVFCRVTNDLSFAMAIFRRCQSPEGLP